MTISLFSLEYDEFKGPQFHQKKNIDPSQIEHTSYLLSVAKV